MPHLSDNADIIFTTETHAPPASTSIPSDAHQPPPTPSANTPLPTTPTSLSIPGYTTISLPKHYQHSRARAPSGGIAIFIRSALAPHTSLWRPRRQATHLWLHISHTAGLPRDLYTCLCYLPPRTSTYHSQLPSSPSPHSPPSPPTSTASPPCPPPPTSS